MLPTTEQFWDIFFEFFIPMEHLVVPIFLSFKTFFASSNFFTMVKLWSKGKKSSRKTNFKKEKKKKNCWVHYVCSLDENRSNIEHEHDQIEKLNIMKWHVVEVLHSPAFVAVFTCILHFM